MNRLQTPMMTRRSVNTSIVLMGSTPFLANGGKEAAPDEGSKPPPYMDSALAHKGPLAG
ncbi:MAG: hypothetical protein LUD78_11655 [Clostridiales bacterium]|nr:hypothetical protein [Clostridiales bacterium]